MITVELIQSSSIVADWLLLFIMGWWGSYEEILPVELLACCTRRLFLVPQSMRFMSDHERVKSVYSTLRVCSAASDMLPAVISLRKRSLRKTYISSRNVVENSQRIQNFL